MGYALVGYIYRRCSNGDAFCSLQFADMAAQKRDTVILSIIRLMFSRRFSLATLLIFIASAVCIRLSIWQLDRLKETRATYSHMIAVQNMPALNLPGQGDLTTME